MKRLQGALLATGLLLVGASHADEAAQIKATHAWIRLLPGDLPASGYVELANTGATSVRLLSISSTVYANAMLHQSTTSASGMSEMSMVAKLPIPAHSNVALTPAGYHVMLSHALRALKPGDSVQLQLHFDDGSVLDTPFIVRPANALGD